MSFFKLFFFFFKLNIEKQKHENRSYFLFRVPVCSCRSEGMGDRGQGGGWKVPTGLLQLFQRGAPICPPSHLFSDPFSLEALPPQELEDPQMSSRHRETCIDYFLTWRISLFTRCFQWWSRALSGSEIPSCQSLEGIQSYPVLNEQVKDRIQSRLCYWVRWQVMSPFCLGGDWRAHPLSSKSSTRTVMVVGW